MGAILKLVSERAGVPCWISVPCATPLERRKQIVPQSVVAVPSAAPSLTRLLFFEGLLIRLGERFGAKFREPERDRAVFDVAAVDEESRRDS